MGHRRLYGRSSDGQVTDRALVQAERAPSVSPRPLPIVCPTQAVPKPPERQPWRFGHDTVPPATAAASLTVAANAAATKIGIAAPTDPNYAAAQLSVTVTELPTDGTVLLADGVTPGTAGEILTIARLTGLMFKPASGSFAQSSSFTY